MDDIAAAVREFLVSDVLEGKVPGSLTETTPLIRGGLLDSLSTLRLVGFLEERFGIKVEAHEAGVARMNTIHDIVELVRSKQ